MARLENLDLRRIDPKHYRWYQEIVEGGSLLLHRPGASSLHKGSDGLSRNVEGRDRLILAKSSEWAYYRARIRGITEAILDGQADDDEPEALTMEVLDKTVPEELKPLPYAEGLAVSLNYEKSSQDHNYQNNARGDVSAHGAAVAKIKSKPAKYDSKPIRKGTPERIAKPIQKKFLAFRRIMKMQ